MRWGRAAGQCATGGRRGGRCEHPSCERDLWHHLDRLVAERRNGVVSVRVEDGRFGPQRPFPLLPHRPLDHGDLDEPGSGEPGSTVDPADHSGRASLSRSRASHLVTTARPPGRSTRRSSTNTSAGSETIWTASMHITPSDGRCGQGSGGDVGDDKASVASQRVGVLVGLADRFDGEVDSDERGARAGGDLESVAAPTTGQVDQPRRCPQTQQLNDFGDALPRQQTARQHGRG